MMMVFITKVMMWLMVFLMYDLIWHLNTGRHCDNRVKESVWNEDDSR